MNDQEAISILSTLREQGILSPVGTDSPITEDEANRFIVAVLGSREKRFRDENAGMVLLWVTTGVPDQGLSVKDMVDRHLVLLEMVRQGVIDADINGIAGKILRSQKMSEEVEKKIEKKIDSPKKWWQFWK